MEPQRRTRTSNMLRNAGQTTIYGMNDLNRLREARNRSRRGSNQRIPRPQSRPTNALPRPINKKKGSKPTLPSISKKRTLYSSNKRKRSVNRMNEINKPLYQQPRDPIELRNQQVAYKRKKNFVKSKNNAKKRKYNIPKAENRRQKGSVATKTTYMSRLRHQNSKKYRQRMSEKFRELPRSAVILTFEFVCSSFGDWNELLLVNRNWYNTLSKSLEIWRILKRLIEKRFKSLQKIKEGEILSYEELQGLVQRYYFKEKLGTIDIFLKKAHKLFLFNSTKVKNTLITLSSSLLTHQKNSIFRFF